MNGSSKWIAISTIVIALGIFIAWAIGTNSQQISGIPVYWYAVAGAFVIQWIMFIPANAAKTEKFFDLVGGSTYFSMTLVLLLLTPEKSARSWVLTVCVMIWAARLASFLFMRVRKSGKDGRFDEIKQSSIRFFNVWNIQGLWVTFTAAAAWAGISSRANDLSSTNGIDGWLIAGLVVWAIGFAIEVVADKQKSSFRAIPENKGRFINTGLWSVSRHPNYFGEILLWVGIAIIAFPALSGWAYVALLSPIFVFLLLSKVSGVPLLEDRADKTWGGQPDYEEYKRNTPVLFPLPKSGARS